MGAPPEGPPRRREVVCPHCDRGFAADPKALSVVCRHCSKRVIVEDLRIDAYHGVVRLATAGKVEVGKRGHVFAKIRVHELVVQGTVRGEVVAVGRVEVEATGKVFADLCTPSLSVAAGAVLVGRVEVGPRAVALPAGRGEKSGDLGAPAGEDSAGTPA